MSALQLALAVVAFWVVVFGLAWLATDLSAWWQRRGAR